jgi:hypothetical protein
VEDNCILDNFRVQRNGFRKIEEVGKLIAVRYGNTCFDIRTPIGIAFIFIVLLVSIYDFQVPVHVFSGFWIIRIQKA